MRGRSVFAHSSPRYAPFGQSSLVNGSSRRTRQPLGTRSTQVTEELVPGINQSLPLEARAASLRVERRARKSVRERARWEGRARKSA